jgi:hypothetical protein
MLILDAAPGKKHDAVGAVPSRGSDGLQEPFGREETRRRITYEPFVNVSQGQDSLAFRLRMNRLGKALKRLRKPVLARARGELGERSLGQVKDFRPVRAAITLAR